MGSKRKRQEKAKDFVKTKLRVGKTAAKPDNYTDTSFVAKTISLPNQSISTRSTTTKTATTTNKSQDVDLSHHLSLTKHHSSTTRKEVLNYIENHLPSNPSSYKQILTSTIPLILDESAKVRTALMSLLSASAKKQPGLLDLHIRSIILFINSAMTHIQPDIRHSSTKFLDILIEHAGESLTKGYFIKIIRSYFTLMAWNLIEDKKSNSIAISANTASLGGGTKKARIGHLEVLKKFLKVSLFAMDNSEEHDMEGLISVHPQSYRYILQSMGTPQAYASLKLFVKELPKRHDERGGSSDDSFTIKDLDSISAEDLETRKKVMVDVFMNQMIKHLKGLIKEGGEVGREANSCLSLLEELTKVE
ncbi:IPI1 [[Candida] subhashii]|uniref:Pre-rRNA-processing protein n=1 Tax=[Candida] subhashii TaxID=561895 RepID=A0A8J5Q7Y1_9ASCO|nr:IPI1 [[Candida] subhashii]KAG7662684.1 IPI1 [[Candida] subhashii]